MSFFDKKSEVISVELTQYGKHLLSIGKFKPVYYEFFDNDVIYDNEYAGIEENRNSVQERIKNETPYLKPQYAFSGIETKLKEQLKLQRQLRKQAIKKQNSSSPNEPETLQQTSERIYFSSSPLGTSKLDDSYPALNIISHNTDILSTELTKQSDSHVMSIPQLSLEVKNYETEVVYESEQPLSDEMIAAALPFNIEGGSEKMVFKLYDDGTYIKVKENSILLEINEFNSNDNTENFEIEIFEITSSLSGKETFVPLYFLENVTKINNDLIIDVGDNQNKIIAADDPTNVNYYLSIKTDSEIDKELLKNISQKPLTPKLFKN